LVSAATTENQTPFNTRIRSIEEERGFVFDRSINSVLLEQRQNIAKRGIHTHQHNKKEVKPTMTHICVIHSCCPIEFHLRRHSKRNNVWFGYITLSAPEDAAAPVPVSQPPQKLI
jgi:hypothetical protein